MGAESELWTLVAKGGPIVAVLGGFSVVLVAIVLVKLYQFAVLDVRSRRFVGPALAAFGRGDVRGSLETLARSRNPIARAMEAAIRGLHHARHRDAAVREEVSRVGASQLSQLESYLRGLETIGTLSPLLGLLGTVLGMIRAFQRLEEAGTRVDPAVLSGGIWEALLTTAVGLAVAIPALAALSWFEGEVERVRRDMSDATTRIFTQGREGVLPGDEVDEDAPLATEPQHAL
jgi:biopolymer transport protein ExbB